MPGHWQMRRLILALCGINLVRITSRSPVRSASPQRIERWLVDARRRGARAAGQLARRPECAMTR
ncbi:hypothetical protein ACPOLB_27050 [Rubrivivax sp. RP6-9]|uniref:hypothetical protein n=1 Tax=Rubrivivax sp. RP6-9 TaxID=3415750 RepID=UPI003CC526D9